MGLGTTLYQPGLGDDIKQGFTNLGSLFAPPSAQDLYAKNQIATAAAKAQAVANINAGNGGAGDYALAGVADPAGQYMKGDSYKTWKEHPDLSPPYFDVPEYLQTGNAANTFAGQAMKPLGKDQSVTFTPGVAAALKMPQNLHGPIGVGDSVMMPGSGQTPIVSEPGDGKLDSTDAVAADVLTKWRAQPHPPGASPYDDPVVAASLARLGKGGAPQTTIDMRGESAEAAEGGKLAAQRANDLATAADQAPEKIARLRLLSGVLEKTKTGPLAGAAGTAVAVANSLGIAPETLTRLGIDPNQAVNNETAQKLSNELVAGSIGAKNGGFPASNFNVAERQFIEKMFPSISSQPGSNQFVSDVLQARERRTLDKAGAWSQYRASQQRAGKPISFNDFDGQWQQQHDSENVFQPIIDKYNAGGYTPSAVAPQAGQPAPQQGAPAAPSQMQRLTPEQAQALPSGTPFMTMDGRTLVRH